MPVAARGLVMEISSFNDLLLAARAQPEPQRLLFVFTAAELSEDSSPEQRRRFEAGEGGALVPVMSVDKAPDDLADFTSLVAEARQFDKPWTVVFVAAMSGRDGVTPLVVDVELALDRMGEAIKTGNLSAFIPFDRDGHTIQFT